MRSARQGEDAMARKLLILVLLMSISLSGITTVKADGPDTGYRWNGHLGKFDFTFGNLIDTHQQMRWLKIGALQGYIYIQFTGDYIDGVPVARRADCTNPALDCRVGWEVIGVPVSGAVLVQKGPRLWDMSGASLPADPEFVHFHWYHEDAYDSNVDPYNLNPKKPCGLIVGKEYSGFLFKRTAVTTFYWLGGNPDKEMGRLVTPGVDLHSNIYGVWTGGDGGEGEEHDDEGCGGHETGG